MPDCSHILDPNLLRWYYNTAYAPLNKYVPPPLTYNDMFSGLTLLYNHSTARDQQYSRYVTQLYQNCLSGASTGHTHAETGTTYWSANTNGSISNSGLTSVKVGIGNAGPNKALSVTGEISGSSHITLDGNLYMKDGQIFYPDMANSGTFIEGTSDDLYIGADDDMYLRPDDDLFIQVGTTTYAYFDGGTQSQSIGLASVPSARLSLWAPSQLTAKMRIPETDVCPGGSRNFMDLNSAQETLAYGTTNMKLAFTEKTIPEGGTDLDFQVFATTNGDADNVTVNTNLVLGSAKRGDGCAVEVLRIQSGTSVGIMNSTPTSTLDVTGTFAASGNAAIGGTATISNIPAAGVGYTGNKILVSDSGVVEYLTGSQLAQDIGFEGQFWTATTQTKYAPKNMANIGIGVAYPNVPLTVKGVISGTTDLIVPTVSATTISATSYVSANTISAATTLCSQAYELAGAGNSTITLAISGNITTKLNSRQNQKSYIYGTGILGTGGFGVGTANPNEAFTVEGNISGSTKLFAPEIFATDTLNVSGRTMLGTVDAAGDSYTHDKILVLQSNKEVEYLTKAQLRDDLNSSYWSATTPTKIVIESGSTTNVGIGTATPNKKLTVAGDISATTAIYLGRADNFISGETQADGDLRIHSGDDIELYAGDDIVFNTDCKVKFTCYSGSPAIPHNTPGIEFELQELPGRCLIQNGYGKTVAAVTSADSRFYLGDIGGEWISGNTTDLKIASGNDILLAASGGVGIGTSPSASLHISTADNVITKFVSTDSIATIELGDNSTSNQATLTRVANDLKICKDGGNVGLPIAPKTKLDVQHNPTSLSNDTGGGESVTFGTEDGTDTLTAGKLMYLNSSGVWKYADASAASTSTNLLAIALGTAVSNGLLIRGFFDSSSVQGAFAKGAPVYVSESAGAVDFTAPSSSGEIIRIIGHATDTANVIYFNPDGTWVELT